MSDYVAAMSRVQELEAEVERLRRDRDAWKAAAELLMRRVSSDPSLS